MKCDHKHFSPVCNSCDTDMVRQAKLALIDAEIERVEGMKKNIELPEPSLRQYEDRGSAPFFCTLCGMDEIKISDNKEGERYFCNCSYWSDPHNAYVDKSGGKWLGWKDKECAQKTIEEYPSEDNGYNQAVDDHLTHLKEQRELIANQ